MLFDIGEEAVEPFTIERVVGRAIELNSAAIDQQQWRAGGVIGEHLAQLGKRDAQATPGRIRAALRPEQCGQFVARVGAIGFDHQVGQQRRHLVVVEAYDRAILQHNAQWAKQRQIETGHSVSEVLADPARRGLVHYTPTRCAKENEI